MEGRSGASQSDFSDELHFKIVFSWVCADRSKLMEHVERPVGGGNNYLRQLPGAIKELMDEMRALISLLGYARVSTANQGRGIHGAGLRAAGCQKIRSKKKSGTERENRTEPLVMLNFLRADDTLVVTRIDRLARSMKDLRDIAHELKGRGWR